MTQDAWTIHENTSSEENNWPDIIYTGLIFILAIGMGLIWLV